VPRFLLDTNVVSHAIYEPNGVVTKEIAAVGRRILQEHHRRLARFAFWRSEAKGRDTGGEEVEQFLVGIEVCPLEKRETKSTPNYVLHLS